jgi:S1-C subfamily serine protease
VLTNHHVIDGAKKINVRLNGEKDKYPAQLIADNEAGDMALLKIELPAGRKLAPIPLARGGAKIGEDVCALGFPGVMSQNITLTLTKGIVSTLPGPDDAEGFIVTDCKINPGNSGGPLCGFSGCTGMVSAKSCISSLEDSYGLAIPANRLRKFLVEKIPPVSRTLPPEPVRAANFKLSELAEIIAPSVVYIENIQ